MPVEDSFVTIIEPTFVARFLCDAAVESVSSVSNVDAFVDLADGSSWALTIVTVGEVSRLLERWRQTGEVAGGSYFWAAGQLIVPQAGLPSMAAAVRELVRSGEIADVGVRSEVVDPDGSAPTGR